MLGNPKSILYLLLGGVVTSRYWWPKSPALPERYTVYPLQGTNISHSGKKNHLQQCLGMGYLSSQEGIKPNQRQKLWAGFRISEAVFTSSKQKKARFHGKKTNKNEAWSTKPPHFLAEHVLRTKPNQSSRKLSSTLFKWHSFAQDLGTMSVNLKRYHPGVPTERISNLKNIKHQTLLLSWIL